MHTLLLALPKLSYSSPIYGTDKHVINAGIIIISTCESQISYYDLCCDSALSTWKAWKWLCHCAIQAIYLVLNSWCPYDGHNCYCHQMNNQVNTVESFSWILQILINDSASQLKSYKIICIFAKVIWWCNCSVVLLYHKYTLNNSWSTWIICNLRNSFFFRIFVVYKWMDIWPAGLNLSLLMNDRVSNWNGPGNRQEICGEKLLPIWYPKWVDVIGVLCNGVVLSATWGGELPVEEGAARMEEPGGMEPPAGNSLLG